MKISHEVRMDDVRINLSRTGYRCPNCHEWVVYGGHDDPMSAQYCPVLRDLDEAGENWVEKVVTIGLGVVIMVALFGLVCWLQQDLDEFRIGGGK